MAPATVLIRNSCPLGLPEILGSFETPQTPTTIGDMAKAPDKRTASGLYRHYFRVIWVVVPFLGPYYNAAPSI